MMRSIFTLCSILSIAYAKEAPKPNFIIIFTDDQGYQDLGCYGSPDIKTPRIDQMAKEGMKFTSFYAQTVCGPSRAALMTGSYPYRISRDDDRVSPHPEMSQSEITIPEILKPLGYKTGMIGKWDLAGHNVLVFKPDLAPHKQGFDYAFWTPASNDKFIDLYEADKSIEKHADMSKLTKLYTDKSIEFISRYKTEPFFLYLAHTMPHTKLAVSDEFEGKSKGGLYGDVIEEIDYNTGRILDHVKKLGLDENTYIIFTSDNGPWWIRKDHGGHADPLRSAKTSCYDGGFRVPFIIRAPGKVPAGSSTDLVTATIDLLPSIATITGAKAPTDRVIDGVDISEIFSGKQKELNRSFYFYQHQALRAVRVGDWKLHIPHTKKDLNMPKAKWNRHVPKSDRNPIKKLTLYNLKNDISEKKDVAEQYPEVVERLMKHIAAIKKDLGHHDKPGVNARRPKH